MDVRFVKLIKPMSIYAEVHFVATGDCGDSGEKFSKVTRKVVGHSLEISIDIEHNSPIMLRVSWLEPYENGNETQRSRKPKGQIVIMAIW